MARNIEIKARVLDHERLAALAQGLADQGPVELLQDDTFFNTSSGRLKLRVFADGQAELIYYERIDHDGPKTSSYRIVTVTDPDGLREALQLAWGLRGRVRKRRQLYLVGRTRIHLDEVEGLGHYMELEVVLAEGEDTAIGEAEAHRLMAALGIGPESLVSGAYIDLLETRLKNAPR